MQKNIVTLALSLFVLPLMVLSGYAAPLEITPFDSNNQSPLVGIYGLPGPGNFLLLPAGKTTAGINIALASNYAVDDNPREKIILDGETTRLTLTVRHAFSSRLEAGIRMPYIIQGGGFLDSFIEDYHSAFAFPQGGRDMAPRNRSLYHYRKDGVDRLLVHAAGAGFGDLGFTAAYQIKENRDSGQGLTLNIGIKLPTGDSDEFRGSGSADLSLWLTGGADLGRAAGKWTAYGSLGAMFMTESDVLPEQQKSWVGFGSLGLGWIPLPRLAFKVQTDIHSAFYNGSNLTELADTAVQLVAGGTVALWEGSTLDIGIGEDLVVKSSPDVVFYLNLRQSFQ